ncbi:MAG: hypothetical protein ABEI13_02455 [Candidatus Paceibacteria bacterium]
MNTVGLITRVNIGEMPYFQSFVDHHQKLGVSSLHLALQDSGGYLSNFRWHQLKIHFHYNSTTWMKGNADMLNYVENDWVMMLDVDEYIRVPRNFESIQEIINSKINCSTIMVDWILHPRICCTDGPTNGIAVKGGKMLARKDTVLNIRNDHWFSVATSLEPHIIPGFKIQHDWGRGYQDVLIKSALSRFNDGKKSSLSDLKSSSKVPLRLAALGCLHIAVSTADSLHLQNDCLVFPIDYMKLNQALLVAGISNDTLALNSRKLQVILILAKRFRSDLSRSQSMKKVLRIAERLRHDFQQQQQLQKPLWNNAFPIDCRYT